MSFVLTDTANAVEFVFVRGQSFTLFHAEMFPCLWCACFFGIASARAQDYSLVLARDRVPRVCRDLRVVLDPGLLQGRVDTRSVSEHLALSVGGDYDRFL